MGLFFKKKEVKPLYCDAKAIIKLFEQDMEINALIDNLTFEYYGKLYKVGVISDIDDRGKCFDILYYLEKQEFKTLEEFIAEANINGIKFVDLGTIKIVKSEELRSPRDIGIIVENEVEY
ncbi:MAG: hypothetical protein R3Y40_07470 [Eubacteriales bacterium]